MGNSILNNNSRFMSTSVPQSPVNGINPNVIQQLNQFKQTFSGNPQNAVMNMLRSGAMSNAQFQQLSQIAQQLQPFLR